VVAAGSAGRAGPLFPGQLGRLEQAAALGRRHLPALKQHPGRRLAAKVEAAVEQLCRFGWSEPRDACIRRHFGLIGYSPPPPGVRDPSSSVEAAPRRELPTKSERAHAVGRDYVAAGLATEFAVEAKTLRLTTSFYPEALAKEARSL
jgi:hypothetical protein